MQKAYLDVALWVALHGLAHQRAVVAHFPWPAGLVELLVNRLASLRPEATQR